MAFIPSFRYLIRMPSEKHRGAGRPRRLNGRVVRPAEPCGPISRRAFVGRSAAWVAAAAVTGLDGGCAGTGRARGRSTDVRVTDLAFRYDEHLYRAPVKFAGDIMDRATLLTVDCTVRTAGGTVATGRAAMPFNHIFSYPSKTMSHAAKNDAMKALAGRIAAVTRAHTAAGHPLELNAELEPLYLQAAADLSRERQLPDPIPTLCTRVTANAFDSAIHDAYGKAHGRSAFHTYGPAFMNDDLSRYLGPSYKGRYPAEYFSQEPRPRMTLCHLVSAVDPITAAENTKPIGDGLPETLPEWIDHNGLLEFKIKVNGSDLQWDVERVVHIDRVVTETQRKRGVRDWAYVLDFNEKCPNLDYFVRFLEQVKARIPDGFRRIKYVEQPTSRNLRADPPIRMHEAEKLCRSVIDESVIDVESVLLARDLGWGGAVLKSSKGLSSMILLGCVARQEGIFVCGGDMSCPGLALVQTANFQAHLPGITSIEANVRQYFPKANEGWAAKFPGMFAVADGLVRTSELNGPGLGA